MVVGGALVSLQSLSLSLQKKKKSKSRMGKSARTLSRSNAELGERELFDLIHELSRLLADPQQFPVVVVHGNSSSTAVELYRHLPDAALRAYSADVADDSEDDHHAAAAAEAAANIEASASRTSRSAAVRLVTHESAFYGPQICAERAWYVNVLQLPDHLPHRTDKLDDTSSEGECDAESADAPHLRATVSMEEMRQASAEKYTAHFLRHLNLKYPLSLDDDSSAASACDDERDTNQIDSAAMSNAGRAEKEGSAAAVAAEGDVERRNGGRVHWVVPLWLGGHASDLRNVMSVWHKVFSGNFAHESATLVLFVNVDVVDQDVFKKEWALFSTKPLGDTSTRVLSKNVPEGTAMHWVDFPASTRIAAEVLNAAFAPPLLAKLCVLATEEEAEAESSSNATAPHNTLSRRSSPPQASTDASRKKRRWVRLPCLRCSTASKTRFQFRGALVKDIIHTADKINCKACSKRRRSLQTLRDTLHWRWHFPCSKTFDGPRPSWQWLLPCIVPSAHVSPPVSQAASIRPTTTMGTATATTKRNYSGNDDAGAAPVFPYILVSDEAARKAELQLAVRRNTVNAAALRLLSAAAKVSGTAAGSLPQPRYYAPCVVDGGSPLTVDGCLSDIFVLEFVPSLTTGDDWENWAQWLGRNPPTRETSLLYQERYALSLRLVKVTDDFVAVPLPSRDVTTTLLKTVMALLSLLGRGRGVMSWPLLDPREGCRRPRVAFTMTYEFYKNPLLRHRDAAGTETEAATSTEATAAGGEHYASISGGASFRWKSWRSLRSRDITFAGTLVSVLTRMKAFGWVLVWQEDHRLWPTAVAPPCMIERQPATLSQHLNRGDGGAAAINPASADARRRYVGNVLEAWRREQYQRHKVWYDADPALRDASALWHGCDTAEDAAFAQSLERGLHRPHFPSPFTSLDLWQACMVPEDAGMQLWEGQTVFLDNGKCGTIVAFRPPSAKLLVPWTSHATAAERRRWRGQQQRHAAFLRHYRWRRRLLDHGVFSRPVAAAFTALPPYVTQREQDVFPVVRIESRAHAKAAPGSRLVHVLPTRVDTVAVRYPSVCVVAAQEQEQWFKAHPHTTRPLQPPHDVAYTLTRTRHQHLDSVTVLSLPLSPHRVESCGSFFIAQVIGAASRLPSRSWLSSFEVGAACCGERAVMRLREDWARLHSEGRKRSAMLALAAPWRVQSAHGVPFGFIRWASFRGK